MNAYRNEGKVYEIHVNAKFLTTMTKTRIESSDSQINEGKKGKHLFSS